MLSGMVTTKENDNWIAQFETADVTPNMHLKAQTGDEQAQS